MDEKKLTGKLVFEFNPEHPEQVNSIRKMLISKNWAYAMLELDQHLRNMLKYELNSASKETYAQVEEIRKFLYQCLESQNVNFDDDV